MNRRKFTPLLSIVFICVKIKKFTRSSSHSKRKSFSGELFFFFCFFLALVIRFLDAVCLFFLRGLDHLGDFGFEASDFYVFVSSSMGVEGLSAESILNNCLGILSLLIESWVIVVGVCCLRRLVCLGADSTWCFEVGSLAKLFLSLLFPAFFWYYPCHASVSICQIFNLWKKSSKESEH